jgi:hypothetical protein
MSGHWPGRETAPAFFQGDNMTIFFAGMAAGFLTAIVVLIAIADAACAADGEGE